MITTCRREGCDRQAPTAHPQVPAYCSVECQAAVLAVRTIADLDPAHADTETVSADLQAALAAAEDPAKTTIIVAGVPTDIPTSFGKSMPTDMSAGIALIKATSNSVSDIRIPFVKPVATVGGLVDELASTTSSPGPTVTHRDLVVAEVLEQDAKSTPNAIGVTSEGGNESRSIIGRLARAVGWGGGGSGDLPARAQPSRS